MIPPEAEWFQDRAETNQLAQLLPLEGAAVVEPANQALVGGVLAGMGGVGKTQLAARYARTAWQTGTVDLLVWISASSHSAVAAGYAQAAAEVLGTDPNDPEAARAFLAWLEPKPQPNPCRWLVILDDIVDPVDLSGWWPPTSPYGRVLATTRRKDAAMIGGSRRRIEIEVFTEAQALTYLKNALTSHGRTELQEQLTALAEDLGQLPLALSQAAVYLIDSGISCLAYRNRLADRTRSLSDAAPDVLPDNQNHTVAAVWSLSLDRADILRPAGLARPTLQLASAMDPNGIPEPVLTSQPALNYLASHRTCSARNQAEGSVSSDDARAALRVLHRLSLVEHSLDSPQPRIRVHRLIQRVTREALSPTGHADAMRSAADSLLANTGELRDDRIDRRGFIANSQAVINNAQGDLWTPEPHPLLSHLGAALGADCQFDAALKYFHQLVNATSCHLGEESRHTLAMRHNLAYWQWRAGDLRGAAVALRDLLGDALRTVRPSDHLILATRRVLANVRGDSGEVADAIGELTEVYKDSVNTWGAADSFSLDVRHNLSHWQGVAGNTTLASDGIREVLGLRHQEIDPNHMTEEEFDALLGGLAEFIELRGRSGHADEAVERYAKIIEELGQLVGFDNETIRSLRTSLAWWKGSAGDIPGAIAEYTALLEEESNLEAHHPTIRTLRHNLGYWKGMSGELPEAIDILSDLLKSELEHLGPNHPDARLTRIVLTRFHWEFGTVMELPPL
ncbi:NB-ARC domain-containing protein [Streptomyces sp. CA-294286]|uniref:NB-ARC domain-containing protein n=1 Tax=Streptomyces sp. CA-294286 TaxID=3240070 RepID=UPI003D937058